MKTETIPAPRQPAIKNPVVETIYARRAVRKYKDIAVDRATLELLADAGKMAPSAINLQPYRLIIADDRDALQTMSSAIARVAEPFFHLAHKVDVAEHPDPIFYHAPAVIFIIGEKESAWAGMDIGLCAQNIMLAAKSIGLDTCPVGFAQLIEQTEQKNILQLHDDEKVYLAVVIGYGDEKAEFHGRKTDNVSYLIK